MAEASHLQLSARAPGTVAETSLPNTIDNGLNWPTGIAYDYLNGYLYVVTDTGANVTVINPTSGAIVQNISVPGLGPSAYNIAFDPFNGDIYFADTGSLGPGGQVGYNVTVINGTSNTVFKTLNLGVVPTGLAVDTQNGAVYVGSTTPNSPSAPPQFNVTVINGTTIQVAATVSVFNVANSTGCIGPTTLAYDPLSELMYVGGASNVCVINTTTNTFTGFVLHGTNGTLEITGLAYDESNGYVYAASNTRPGVHTNSTLYVINGSTGHLLAESPLPFTAPPSSTGANSPGIGYDGRTREVLVAAVNYGDLPTTQPTFNSTVLVYNGTISVGTFYVGVGANVGPPEMAFDNQTGNDFITNADVATGNGSISIVKPGMPLEFAPSPGSASLVIGTNQTFSAPVTCLDGACSPPPVYSWTLSGSIGTLNSTSGASLRFTASSPGNATLRVTVSADGYNESSSIQISTHYRFIVTFATSPLKTDVNATLKVYTQLSGGSGGPYTYRYSESSSAAGCVFSNASQLACTPTSPGSFTVSVNATDRTGEWSSATSPSISVGPEIHASFAASDSTPLLGQTVAFVVNATGGVPPYNYTYSGFPPGCVSEDKPAVGCLPTQADYYNVTVHVTDYNNVTVNATTSIHVIFDFNVVVPTNTSAGSPFTISVNTNETFSGGTAVIPAAGFGAFTYNYTGLPPGCTSEDAASITCTPTQVGTYHITISVHDQVGDHQTHTVVVNVVPAKSTPGILGLPGNTGYLVAGGVVAVAAAAIAVFVVLSRRSKRDRSKGAPVATNTPESVGKTGSGPTNP